MLRHLRAAPFTLCAIAMAAAPAACDNHDKPTKETPAARASAAASVASSKAASRASKRAASVAPNSTASSKKRPATDQEKAAYAPYRAAIDRGRLATQRKQLDQAVAAFDEALEAMPRDPRALAERGYAKLLAGDLDGAQRDFDAVPGTSDEKLWAQVWFNRGLVHEKRGDQKAALEAFAMSQSLSSTKAAAAKLDGKTLCPVSVRRSTGKVYPNWMALWKDAVASAWSKVNDPANAPKDEAAVRRTLRTGTCKTVCAAHVTTDEEVYHVVAPKPDGSLLFFADVFRTLVFRCGGAANMRVVPGAALRVVFSVVNNEYTMFCDPQAPPGSPCMTGCVDGSWIEVEAFVDVGKARLLRLQRTGPIEDGEAHVSALSVDARGIMVPGCAAPIRLTP